MRKQYIKIIPIVIIKTFITCLLITLTFFCIFHNDSFIFSFKRTLYLWLYKVIPSIFTFYVIINILIYLNILDKILIIFKPLRFIFRFESNIAFNLFIISIFTGNPSAASLIYHNYQNNTISKSDYEKLILSSGFVTPLFIISLFNNDLKKSFIILLSHILSYFFTCIVITINNKNINICKNNKSYTNKQNITSIFYNAVTISLTIASIMVFVNLIITSLIELKVAKNLLLFFELSCGITMILENNFTLLTLPIISFLLSFNGLCLHLQVFSQITDVSYGKFFFFRLLQGLLSATISYFILL